MRANTIRLLIFLFPLGPRFQFPNNEKFGYDCNSGSLKMLVEKILVEKLLAKKNFCWKEKLTEKNLAGKKIGFISVTLVD